MVLLHSDGFTEIFIANGDSAADFANILSAFYEGLVLFWVAYLKAEIVQITKVLAVACVRHI
jgi:hypothetical protein